MSDIWHVVYLLLTLSVPFMMGVIVGRGIRPGKTLEHRLGEVVIDRIRAVRDKRQFVGVGASLRVKETFEFEDGRCIDLIVQEEA